MNRRKESQPARQETYQEAYDKFNMLLIGGGKYSADTLKQALRNVSDLTGIGVVKTDHTTLALRHNAVSIFASQAAALAEQNGDKDSSKQFKTIAENAYSIASVLDPKLPAPKSQPAPGKPLSASKTSGAKTP